MNKVNMSNKTTTNILRLLTIILILLVACSTEDYTYEQSKEAIRSFSMKEKDAFLDSVFNIYVQLESGEIKIIDAADSINSNNSYVKKGETNELVTITKFNSKEVEIAKDYIFVLDQEKFEEFNIMYVETFDSTLPIYNNEIDEDTKIFGEEVD